MGIKNGVPPGEKFILHLIGSEVRFNDRKDNFLSLIERLFSIGKKDTSLEPYKIF